MEHLSINNLGNMVFLQVSTSIEVNSVDEAAVVERDGFIVKRQNNKEAEVNGMQSSNLV